MKWRKGPACKRMQETPSTMLQHLYSRKLKTLGGGIIVHMGMRLYKVEQITKSWASRGRKSYDHPCSNPFHLHDFIFLNFIAKTTRRFMTLVSKSGTTRGRKTWERRQNGRSASKTWNAGVSSIIKYLSSHLLMFLFFLEEKCVPSGYLSSWHPLMREDENVLYVTKTYPTLF